ncbi:hypothetical protein CA236_00105 [Sphingomonas sp. ABOLG]|uniref:hypothetical protein n=1 Tax=Sphingomonas sp. ABOLG TaxID=1985880 RepID=UPI000F7E81B8|nr:hypothetical protein [Sphingomonas sp. ABOLG]RSV20356.1 hypothetical protein CA236_00105 [Sphingomonas sp. ABOLG]
MGLFGAIAGLFGGGSQKKASQKATDALVAAYNRGIDTQNAFNQQVRQDYVPYTRAGTAAIGELSSLAGLGDDASQQAMIDELRASPLYASLYRNGEEALLQNAAATGGLRGGNTQRGLADFGADTLAQVYQQTFNNLSGLAGLGMGAQGTVTQVGGNTVNNVTNLLSEIGGAKANNFLAKGRINAENWANIGGFLDDAVANFIPGGSLLSKLGLGNSGAITSRSTGNLNLASQSVLRGNPSIF